MAFTVYRCGHGEQSPGQAGSAQSTSGTNKGPAAGDPHARAGPRSRTCAADHWAERVQATVLPVTHRSHEIKLRNMTTTEKLARKCVFSQGSKSFNI